MPSRTTFKSIVKIFILCAWTAIPAQAAGDSAWIVSGGTSGSYDTQSASSGTSSNIGVNLGIGHSIGSSFEFILNGSYFSSTAGVTTLSLYEVSGDLLFCIAGDHTRAFYAGARGGIVNLTSGGTSGSSTIFGAVAGKRFNLSGIVSYDPNISAVFANDSSGISNPRFRFVPLQLTLVF